MKTTLTTISAALISATVLAAPAFADEPAVPFTGAELGVWTQDYVAATNAAATDGKPVFLDFTGSDWCGWCMLMEDKVFSTDAWKAWAATNLYLVTLDFPHDKSIVPEKYKARNDELSKAFGVSGYPTYIVLDAKGQRLGRLGADRNATPAKFIRRLCGVLGIDPPANANAAPADPAVQRLVAGIAAAQQATEKAATGRGIPTVGQFTQIVEEQSAALAALETNGVPDSVLLPFGLLRESIDAMAAECKKLDQNKSLEEFRTPPAGIKKAILNFQGAMSSLIAAAEAAGVEDAADLLHF